jgi:integrase
MLSGTNSPQDYLKERPPLKIVSKLLGHSDTSITANTYTDLLLDEKIKAIEKLNNIFEIRG